MDVPILAVWERLGGGEIRHGRGRAFWRNGDGWNVSIDLEHNRWLHFPTQAGGGPLQLVEVALPADRRGALNWLQAEGFIEPRRQLTPEEKRQYAQTLADAKAQARLALAWLTERLFELDLAKTAAVDFASDRIAVDALTAAAAEHCRLSQLDAPGVIRAWQAARLADPAETKRLERGGLAWRATCESLTRAVVDSLKGGDRDVA